MDLTHDGITQPVAEWALDYGIPAELILSRLNLGWSEERAITQPMRVRRGDKLPEPKLTPKTKRGAKAKLITFGDLSLTATEWGARVGLTANAIHMRLAQGWPLERALAATNQRAANLIEFGGESLSIAEWADRLGLTEAAIRQRLSAGWTVDRTLTTRKLKGRPRRKPDPLPLAA